MRLPLRPAVFGVVFGTSAALGCSDSSADSFAEEPLDPTTQDAGADDVSIDTAKPNAPDQHASQPPADNPHAEPPPLSPACAALASGLNDNFDVDGLARSFILDLPDDVEEGGPWPVVFNFHGLGDTAQNMRFLFSGSVNRPDFPFIAVTPEDTNFVVGALGMTVSLDWDVFQVGDGSTNREVRLFDEVLACLDSRYGVDRHHIHTSGFSIGGIVADLIGVVRGEQIASIATYSGGYFSNPDNVKSLGILSMVGINWPQSSHDNRYPQLMLFGGQKDVWSPTNGVQVKFYEFAKNDLAAMTSTGHDVIYCNHDGGHRAPPPGMPGARVIDFFRDHPKGLGRTPYADGGLPSNFADYCKLHAVDEDD